MFVRDQLTGTTERVSVNSAEVQGNRHSRESVPAISASVAAQPTQTAGLSLVSVEIESGPSILYESADWVVGVRVLDPGGRTSRSPQRLTTSTLESMASSPPRL